MPPFFPEALLLYGQVSLPVLDIRRLSGSFHHQQLAPVTDEGHLNLHWRVSMVWSRQRKAGGCYFADHLAAAVEAPRLPFPYLFK